MNILSHSAAAAALLALGPCFRLRIDTDVSVQPDGSSIRNVVVSTNQPKHASLMTELPTDVPKDIALVVLTNGGFVKTTLPPAFGQPGKDEKDSVAWGRSRGVPAMQKTTDLTMHRRGEAAGGGNEAVVTVDDYVVFQRICYRETIRDSATRESVRTASESLASRISDVLKHTFREMLGANYELKHLENWLQTDFRRDLRDTISRLLELRGSISEIAAAIDDALTLSGIAFDRAAFHRMVSSPSPEREDTQKVADSIVDGTIAKIASLLRRRGATDEEPGAPVTAAELQSLKAPNAFEEAFNRGIEKLGDPNIHKLDDLFHSAGSELFGSFGGAMLDPDLDSAEIRWRTVLRMPGQLLRTNGVPLHDGSVLWMQLPSDLGARSTLQEAESIVFNTRAISTLGGDVSGVTPEDILELISELGEGRSRAPEPKKVKRLRDALESEPDLRAKILRSDDLDRVRTLLHISVK
jgi:hypothetical protein